MRTIIINNFTFLIWLFSVKYGGIQFIRRQRERRILRKQKISVLVLASNKHPPTISTLIFILNVFPS